MSRFPGTLKPKTWNLNKRSCRNVANVVEERKVEQFKGDPREPVPVPLSQAADLGIHQVLDKDGAPNGSLPEPDIADEDLVRMYETMVMVRAIDERGWQLQRSGRVAFWIPICGQEAAHIGSAFVMKPSDWIFRGHRDLGVMLLRGCSLEQLFAQFFGRATEPLKDAGSPAWWAIEPSTSSHPRPRLVHTSLMLRARHGRQS